MHGVRYSPVDVMVMVVGVGRRRGRRRVLVVVHGAEVVAALRRGAEVGAAAAQVHAVRGAGARRARLEHLLEVRVGLHVARVCRRPQLLVAARVGRRQRARVGVAERRQGGRALRVSAALRAALRLALCAHAHNTRHERRTLAQRRALCPRLALATSDTTALFVIILIDSGGESGCPPAHSHTRSPEPHRCHSFLANSAYWHTMLTHTHTHNTTVDVYCVGYI